MNSFVLNSDTVLQAQAEKASYESIEAFANAIIKLQSHASLQPFVNTLPFPREFNAHLERLNQAQAAQSQAAQKEKQVKKPITVETPKVTE